MSQFRLTPEADEDLISIWSFISQDNIEAADRAIDGLIAKFDLLAQNPKMGRLRPELGRSLRSFTERRYVVFYRLIPEGVEIVRVLHGARDIESIFEQ